MPLQSLAVKAAYSEIPTALPELGSLELPAELLEPVPQPFAQLLDPAGLAAAVARSERLARLRRRVFRPLDRPWIPHSADERARAEFDRQVERASARELARELAEADAH